MLIISSEILNKTEAKLKFPKLLTCNSILSRLKNHNYVQNHLSRLFITKAFIFFKQLSKCHFQLLPNAQCK